MSGSIFLNAPDDVQWLKETHLQGIAHPDFASFILYGNEDCPEKVYLYANAEPNYSDLFTEIVLWEDA